MIFTSTTAGGSVKEKAYPAMPPSSGSQERVAERFLLQDLVPLVQEALEEGSASQVLNLLERLHALDIAKLIQYLRGSLMEESQIDFVKP